MYHFATRATPAAAAKIPTDKPAPNWWTLDVTPRQPKGFVGLQWAEPDETLFSLARPQWVKDNKLTVQDLYGRAAFRAGIDPQDDYLLLDGVHLGHAYDDQNGILEYSALGRTFLVSLDYGYGTKQSAHNVVAVSVDGMADVMPALVAVRRLWADLPSFAATRTALLTDGRGGVGNFNHPSADWERNILWLKNRFFLVFDRVIARRDGFHSAIGFWRMVGERSDLPDGIEMRQQAGDVPVRFRLTVGDVDHFALGREEDPQAAYCFTRYGKQPPPLDNVPPIVHMLKAHKARQLRAGESFGLWTCFSASSPKRPTELTCQSVQPNAMRVMLNGKPMLAALGPATVGKLGVDAELSLISDDRVCFVAGRKLALDGKTIFESLAPISFEWNLSSGECAMDAKSAAKAFFLGQALEVPEGRSSHRLSAGDVSQRLASSLQSLPSLPSQRPKHLPGSASQLQIVTQRDGKSGVECLWAGKLGSAGEAVLVGRQDGAVEALGGDALKPLWTYRCERVVNSIDAGDLDGDGQPEIAVGSDDHHLHTLGRDGKLLWKWKPPFDELKAKIAYCQWLWPEPFVKKVAVHDTNGDGKAEIVAGTGMDTVAVNGRGQQLWAFHAGGSHWPSMRAIVFLDVNGDGVDEPVGGASDVWYHANMSAIGPKGEELKAFAGDGWCSGVKVALAEDILGTGKKSLVWGTRLGGLSCYPDPNNAATRWYRRFGDEIDLLATLRHKDNTKLIAAAGGDTKWVTAFDPKGEKLWAVYFDAAVT
ncbi:MAG: VCBS repeat-containing protein, partial [Planctomycetes bacterium]|nr:VCBS repeat-containing protein [Planctomycetota bacterium]